jgi:hypothetical protein
MSKTKVTRAPCRHCLRETKHVVIGLRNTSDEAEVEGVGYIDWSDRYEMLECAGCETVCLRQTHWFSEEPEPQVTYYPPAVSRRMPLWRYKTPYRIADLMGEIYTALHNDSRSLALMGARTIVDLLLVDKVGDAGSFSAKLQKLEAQGFVGKQSRAILEAALDAGSAAAHRAYKPTTEHLNQIMDIVENLLESVYVLEKGATEIRKATPQRPGKKRA